MTSTTTKSDSLQPAADMAGDLFDNWFDPLEAEVRARSREFIEELLRGELEAALSRPRYGRNPMSGGEGRASVAGHRHGSRTRSLTGTFGPVEIAVPRARLTTADGKTTEWKPDDQGRRDGEQHRRLCRLCRWLLGRGDGERIRFAMGPTVTFSPLAGTAPAP
jgi:hypothetical protein